MDNLEARLAHLNTEEIKASLLAKLENRAYKQATTEFAGKLKYDFIDKIIERIDKYAPTAPKFYDNLNSKVNKNEAKRIWYGIVCMQKVGYSGGLKQIQDPDPAVKQICAELGDWEKIGFFAGVWADRIMADKYNMDVPQLVFNYIKKGIANLHKHHMVKKAMGDYIRTLKIPGSQNYHKDKEPDTLKPIAVEFKKMLDKEDGAASETAMEDAQERTGIWLDSVSKKDRKYLTEVFGVDKLGGYAAI